MNPFTWLKNLKLKHIALVDRGANPEADIVLAKRDDTETAPAGHAVFLVQPGTKTTGAGTMPDMDIQKAIDAAVAEAVKKQSEEVAALKKRADDAEAAAKASAESAKAEAAKVAKMEADRRHEQFIAKAKTYDAIPGASPDDFASLLEVAETGMTAEQTVKFEQVLKGANEAIKQGQLFATIGSGRSGNPTGAEAKMKTAAQELQKADGKLSYPQAFAKVMTQQPELYKQYLAEKES